MPKIKKGDIVIPRNPSVNKEFLEKCGWRSKKMAAMINVPYISMWDFIGRKCKIIIVGGDGTAEIENSGGIRCWWTQRHLRRI